MWLPLPPSPPQLLSLPPVSLSLPLSPPPSSPPPSLMVIVFISQLSEASASLSSRMLKGASCWPAHAPAFRGQGGRCGPVIWSGASAAIGMSKDTLAALSVLGKVTHLRMPRTSATRAATPTLRRRCRASRRPSTSTRLAPLGLPFIRSFSQSPPLPHAAPSVVASTSGWWAEDASDAAAHPPPPLPKHGRGDP